VTRIATGPRVRSWRAWAARAMVLVLLSGPRLSAEPLAADQQVLPLLKVLIFDRNFEHRVHDELTIGVVFVPADPASVRAKNEVVKTLSNDLKNYAIKRLPIRHVAIEFTSAREVEAAVRANKVNLLFVTPLAGANLDDLLTISHSYGIPTMTGVPEYVERGVAVGIRQEKPQILIHLKNARTEGIDFDASLLRIAKIVGGK
jgi:YfiR/HmsC-like